MPKKILCPTGRHPKRYDIVKILINYAIKQPMPVGAGPVRLGPVPVPVVPGADRCRCRCEIPRNSIIRVQRFLRSFSGTGTRTKCRFRHKTGTDRNRLIQYRHIKLLIMTFFKPVLTGPFQSV
jgi:hypothetical protein